MDKYNSKTVFHIPGLFNFTEFYEVFLDIMSRHPEYYKDNVVIGSIFDSPKCIWNGGRLVMLNFSSKAQLTEIKDMMSKYNIPARFTFTNSLLENNHLFDRMGNMILDIFNTGNNEVICGSQILEDYIRTKYSNSYRYISSTTKRLTDKNEQTKELDKNYYLVVIDYKHNKDFEYLNTLSEDSRSKCEILVNDVCVPNCPLRAMDYRATSEHQLNFDFDMSEQSSRCLSAKTYGGLRHFRKMLNTPTIITAEDINEKYLPLNINNFKIQGRVANTHLNLADTLAYYLIKDKYRGMFITEIINKVGIGGGNRYV